MSATRNAALVAAPLAGLLLVGTIVGSSAAIPATTAAAASVACLYGNPQADVIADTFYALTPNPVDETRWLDHRDTPGLELADVAYTDATDNDKQNLLATFVRTTLNQPGATITAPAVLWWHGTLPADNDDTTWTTTTVPGWDGTLDSYVIAYLDTYTSLLPADYTCTPATSSSCPQPANLDAITATIRHLESGNRYSESAHSVNAGYPAASGNPSGAYQFLATTWNNYGGYPEAWQAPPAIQDRRALDDINRILTRFGSVDYVPVAWYVGDGGANNVRTGEWPLSYLPNPAYNTITIGDYQTKWLDHYRTIALPAAGVTPTPCPTGMAAIIAWAETQLGNPYAAIDPWRFGTPTWPGGTRTGARGDIYTFPAGTTVYDCSGFVIAAYRQIGIDFVAQYGISGSQLFNTTRIPDADRNALQPGDIAVYEPVNGVGHIVLIHHIEPDGTVRTIEASPTYGVHIGTLRWQRVTALKRPVMP